tara:strand:+ start:309 stop:548 length:240 start_codon:yes stop_codon:yes gene_type:complete
MAHWAVNKINDLAEKISELELALCHVNNKLFRIENICQQELYKFEENEEDVTDGSYEIFIYEGRAEFARQILRYLNKGE